MITIEIKLKNQEYGARSWGNYRTASNVEMPPSPMRVMRSIGFGMFKQLESAGLRPLPVDISDSSGDIDIPEEWQAMLLKLASVQPGYYIPNYHETGRESYTPNNGFLRANPIQLNKNGNKKNGEPTRQIFDTFAIFDPNDSSIYIQYNVDLTASEKEMLSSALRCIKYLGRSEYAARWKMIDELPVDKTINCFPDPNGCIDSMMIDTTLADAINIAFQPTKQSRLQGQSRNDAIQNISYTLVRNQSKAQTAPAMELESAPVKVVYQLRSETFIDDQDGLTWTDLFHKALVKHIRTPRFTGFGPDGELPEQEKVWLSWESNALGKIEALTIHAPSGLSSEEVEGLHKVTTLYRVGESASLSLLAVFQEQMPLSTTYRSATPVLLYTMPRKGNISRTCEAQVINTLHWTLNGNTWGEEQKITDFKRQQDGSIRAEVPNVGWVKVKLDHILKHGVVTQRGNRSAGADWGFSIQVETETPVSLVSCGWGRRFGAGRLVAA